MAVEYEISSDVATIKDVAPNTQVARVVSLYSGQITYDDEAGSKFATATIDGKSQRVMLCIAISGTVTYDDVPCLYSTVDGHRCLNIVSPTETGTPDDVPSVNETVVIDGKNVRAVRCILINATPVYDGVSSVCTFTGDDGKTHTAQLVNKITGGSVEVIVKGVSPLVLPDAIADSLSYVKAFGGTEQNGTPTPDAPMYIVSNNGALKYSFNMANVNAQTALVGCYISSSGVVTADANNWIYQDYIPVSPNTTYTLTMSSSVYYVTISEYSTADDSGFIRRNAGTSGDNTTLTITTDATTNFIRFGTNIDRAEVTLERVLAINWMLNKGDSMPYTPYSPTGVYADGTVETIWAHTKNLFDASTETVNKFLNDTGAIVTNTNYAYSDLIPVVAGKTYTASLSKVSGAPSGTLRIHTYDSDGVWQQMIFGSTAAESATITIPTGISYVRISWWKAEYATDRQFELGSTATTYAPYYDGGTATAEMLLSVGDYTDVQELLSGLVTRNVGVKVLNGTETWTQTTTNVVEANIMTGQQYGEIATCSHLTYSSAGSFGAMPDNSFKTGTATYQTKIYCKSSIYTTDTTTWKQFLADQYDAGTPVIVVYPLATPTTESVAGQTLQVTDGDNVLEVTQASLNGLELEAQYQAAVSLTIQEVQDANLDPNVQVTIN